MPLREGFVPTSPRPIAAVRRARCHPEALAISFKALWSGVHERLGDLIHGIAGLSQPDVNQRKQSLEEIAQWQL